jgi:NTP pyrophosphatase (non-canonical NTP hydrolase)
MSADPPTKPRSDLDELRDALRAFAAERDWEQFHTPRNLATALIVECAELLEHFQWLGDGPAARLPDDKRAAVREELADVLLYLVRLSDRLGVDLHAAALDKIEANARKYPVDKARGRSTKYTEW